MVKGCLILLAMCCLGQLIESCTVIEDGSSVIGTHNMLRARHGVPNLSFDATLASHAAKYAKKLCETKTFKHDTGELRRYKEGENLYYGRTSTQIDVCIATYKWYNEVNDMEWSKLGTFYNFMPIPTNLGHFTQLVWKSTSRVGCGTAYRKEGSTYHTYIACRYKTPGNVQGRVPQNVSPTSKPRIGLLDVCSECSDSDPAYCATIKPFDCTRGFFGIADTCKKTCGKC